MPDLSQSIRRLAATVAPVAAAPMNAGGVVVWRNLTVASVTSGAAADGAAAVTVTDGINTFPAPYLAQYTPVVGHMVTVRFIDGSPLIFGRPIGLPAF